MNKVFYQTRILSCFPVFLVSFLFFFQTGTAQESNPWVSVSRNDGKLKKYLAELDDNQDIPRDSMQFLLRSGYEVFLRDGYVLGQAEFLFRLGIQYSRESMLSASIEVYEEAVTLFTELGDEVNQARSLVNLGMSYGRRGDYDQATSHLLESLKIYEKLGDKRGIVDATLKLGTVNAFLGQYDVALDYYFRALDLSGEEINVNVITLYGNIAFIYMEQGDFEKSESYFKKAITSADSFETRKPLAQALLNLGQMYKIKGDQMQADHYFDRAAILAEEDNMLDELIAISLVRVDDSTREGQRRSLMELTALNERAESLEMKYMQLEILNKMISLSKGLSEHEQTIRLMEERDQIDKQLFDQRKERDIANLRAAYELDKSKSEILNLNERIAVESRMTMLILFFSIVLAIGFVIAIYYYIHAKRANRLLLESKRELSASNQVKDRLFSIIGHDLKNAISSQPLVLELIKSGEYSPDEYNQLLDGLESSIHEVVFVLDTLLNWGKMQIKGVLTHPVHFNVGSLVENSVRLIQLSAGLKDIHIENKVPADMIIHADQHQFRFVVRNLLANAIKYSRGGDRVTIGVHEQHNDQVTFYVEDTGMGMDAKQVETIFDPDRESIPGTSNELGNSIALILSREFIVKHRGKIWVTSEKDKGTTFYFSFSASTNP